MYQRPIAEENPLDPETTASPLRGVLIAVPLAVGLWFCVVELAAYLL